MPEFVRVGPVEQKLLGMLPDVTQKSFCGQIYLDNTEITFAVVFSLRSPHPRMFKLEPLMCLHALTFLRQYVSQSHLTLETYV